MPLRGDYDIEHDNDAELVLADMEFVADDHASERELKRRVVQIYNAKLDERERRKAFVGEVGGRSRRRRKRPIVRARGVARRADDLSPRDDDANAEH